MTRPSPATFPEYFAAAFSSGNVDAVLDLYLADAVLIDQQRIENRGHAEIRKLLIPVLARGAKMSINPLSVIEYGDLAVLRNKFEVTINEHVVVKGVSFEVLRLELDGWKLAIDCPYA
jgi:ketosteroid isomerase-like protein